jgi:hypothetical protein
VKAGTGELEGRMASTQSSDVVHALEQAHCVLLRCSRNTLPDEDLPCSACARAEASTTWLRSIDVHGCSMAIPGSRRKSLPGHKRKGGSAWSRAANSVV